MYILSCQSLRLRLSISELVFWILEFSHIVDSLNDDAETFSLVFLWVEDRVCAGKGSARSASSSEKNDSALRFKWSKLYRNKFEKASSVRSEELNVPSICRYVF